MTAPMRRVGAQILPRRVHGFGLFALLAAGCGSDSGSSEGLVGGRWRAVAAAPLSGRFLPAAVWTGAEVLVWGGAGCQGEILV